MARKRMFRLDVLETDAFMDMPLTAQALYFHLNLRADDDGFIGNPNQIVRSIGASADDLKLLIAKRFVLTFEDGVIVIKHWRLHNTLSSNRYKETNFLEDKALLRIKDNKSYTFDTNWLLLDDARLVEMSARQTKDEQKTNIDEQKTTPDKNSIDKKRKENNNKTFTKPTVDDVKTYCEEKGYTIDPEQFIDFYESKNWMIGKNKMCDWKAAIRTWVRSDKNKSKSFSAQKVNKFNNFEQRKYNFSDLEKEAYGV